MNIIARAERRTIQLTQMELLVAGVFFSLDVDILKAMENSSVEARVNMFLQCITDPANAAYLKGELSEKQYLEKIGGSNISALFKETGSKDSKDLRNFIERKILELSDKYCDRLEETVK